MPLLGRPSRSYKNVEHDAAGLAGVGAAPYASMRTAPSVNGAADYGVKTYRPSYADLHFKRQADPHPGSSFSPLPPAFQLGRKHKEQARAGQRAELDHILEPGYKTASIYGDEDNASVAGPSRLSSVRTAGGLSALSRRTKDDGLLRHSGSVTNFMHGRGGGGDGGSGGGGGLARRALGGVYVDSTGKLHDTEYDPFAGVSEISRRKSRRRSAFGGHRRGSCSSGSVSGSSDDSDLAARPRTSFDTRMTTEEERERDEIRRRLEVERRRLDEVSGYAAARRKSMMSDRASGILHNGGRATPSIRSGHDDGVSVITSNGGTRTQSRVSQHHVPSPLTPTFEDTSPRAAHHDRPNVNGNGNGHGTAGGPGHGRHRSASTISASSYNTGRVSGRGTSSAGGGDESPRKHTETTPPEAEFEDAEEYEDAEEEAEEDTKPPPAYKREMSEPPHSPVAVDEHRVIGPEVLVPAPLPKPPPVPEKKETITTIRSARAPPPQPLPKPTKQTVERAPDGATRITGFDAGPPRAPVVPTSVASRGMMKVPESVRSGGSSRSSERYERGAGGELYSVPRQKPVERPREQVFPETPAQAKRREEKERRNLRAGRTSAGSRAVDTMTVTASARTRILPEIEIVEDDDPRIIFPPNGHTTRIQSHALDRTIRSHDRRLDTSGPTRLMSESGSIRDSTRSIIGTGGTGTGADSNKAPSVIIEETGGGYLPSRWASGDRQLRLTEEEKDRYRPTEWGGRHGDLGGRTEEWRPDAKDQLKRNLKDLSTNARFSMFRAKKKILRKTEL